MGRNDRFAGKGTKPEAVERFARRRRCPALFSGARQQRKIAGTVARGWAHQSSHSGGKRHELTDLSHGPKGTASGQKWRTLHFGTTKTYEIVATVDGLDVLSGQPGSTRNRGYVLRPGEHLRIKGFRKSGDEIAAFRFESVTDSYAANSAAGSPANVGVIGTAIFELNAPPPAIARPCRSGPCAFPNDENNGQGRYAAPPVYD